MPLDSDIANADAQLSVRFYEYEMEPYKGQPFIEIMTPGNQLNIIKRPVKDYDKRRFPQHWLAFQMQNAGDVVVGTPLKQWNDEQPDAFTIFQMQELQILKFQTVEQVAQASDSQLQRVGMGGPGMRERARAYLIGKHQRTTSFEHDQTKAELAELKAQMAEMMAQMQSQDAPKRGPGRPRNPVNVQHDDAATGATGNE